MADRLVTTRDLNGDPVEIYERTAMIPNAALSMIPTPMIVECFYVLPAPGWPKIRIRARRGLARVGYALGRRTGTPLDPKTVGPQFRAAFRVDCDEPDFAHVFLAPPLQRHVLTKRTVDWSAGEGAIRLFYRGKLRTKRIDAALQRLRLFRDAIDPELYAIFAESEPGSPSLGIL